MIVVDASVLANAIGDDEHDGNHARELLRQQQELAAPDLSTSRPPRYCGDDGSPVPSPNERFDQAVTDLADFPITRYPTRRMMRRAFELRANVTASDSCYVVLAETLECPLYTADARLTRTSGPRCSRLLIEPQRGCFRAVNSRTRTKTPSVGCE